MSMNQYLKALQTVRSPAKAATYIRAFEAMVSGCGGAYDVAANLRRAEERARQLERDWRQSADSEPGPVPLRVMRQWLREWGYI